MYSQNLLMKIGDVEIQDVQKLEGFDMVRTQKRIRQELGVKRSRSPVLAWPEKMLLFYL